ncbi:hypothetical protein HDU83_009413 [Entophlyctis luteolus]|nr:hypothetical protein HDU83_009413 [Entophlyctis luteolus]
MSLDLAFVDWARTFDLSKSPSSIRDFCDGTLFNELLAEIDPVWFKRSRNLETGDNWVLRFNGLKKTYKLITSYYEEVLVQPYVRTLNAPNLTAIARDDDSAEALVLATLIIVLAVQCENNQTYISRIQTLGQEQQHALMLAIEQIITQLNEAAANAEFAQDLNRPGSSAAIMSDEKALLETQNSELNEQLQSLKAKYDQLISEKLELKSRLESLSAINDYSEPSSGPVEKTADFVLKSQIDNLKSELDRSEARREDTERSLQQQIATIIDLKKKLEEANRKADEAARLKDELDEFKHFADKLQKSEAMIEKYKKKMEETTDMRKQMKVLEAQNSQLQERSHQLEEEYRKVSSYKPLMDTYKEQIAGMESKNSMLQVENSKLEFEAKETRSKLDRLEAMRRSDLDQIQLLEEQVRELELMGGLQVSSEDSLGNDLNNSLRSKIAQLEQELASVKPNESLQDRIYVLENLLEDSKRLKEKFEIDYMQTYQKNLALENEMKQLRTVSMSDNDAVVQKLRAQIGEYQQELNTAQQRLAEAEIAIMQGMGGAANGGGAGGAENGVASGLDHETIKRQIDSYEKEQRIQAQQISKLQNEKMNLEALVAETRDSLMQAERTNEDLKAALASFESKTAADETAQKVADTTQKIVLLTEQNTKVLKALKEAKKHILTQDKQIKDLKATVPKDNFVEAIQSYEAQLAEKNLEIDRAKKELVDTRRAAKREQALMLSAWHELGISQQRRAHSLSSGRSDGETPMSWLAQQRQESVVHRRR